MVSFIMAKFLRPSRPVRASLGRSLVALSILATACTGGGGASLDEKAGGDGPDRSEPRQHAGAGVWRSSACRLPKALVERVHRDFYPGRSPELIVVPKRPNYFGGFIGTSHSGPWDYVQKVPIVFYGPGFIKPLGKLRMDREVTVADIAPTLAELLDTPFPAEDRPGTSISQALAPATGRRPELVLVVVWDGGGSNVLEAHPNEWPNLARLIEGGTSVQNATVGSSPSSTPPIHTNIGTGAFPRQHGIVDISLRIDGDIVDSFKDMSPRYMEIPTLADLYDRAVGNRAEVGAFGYIGWHLGMMSHGSYIRGGDDDIAVLYENSGEGFTSSRWYELPEYVNSIDGIESDIQEVDADDGRVDDEWFGNDVFDNPFDIKHSPAAALYQNRVIKELLRREGFGGDDVTDLFFTNYKAPDAVGHVYNMLSPESRSALRLTDEALGDLVSILDETVGKKRWAMVVTADHGQTPLPTSTSAWPINMTEFEHDLAGQLGADGDDLFDRTRPGHLWVNETALEEAGATMDDMVAAVLDYRASQNVASRDLPEGYAQRLGEKMFDAAWPSEVTDDVWKCVSSR
ncbi:MAG: alkaline phosphatase family protein [Actinomycetota bacterium]